MLPKELKSNSVINSCPLCSQQKTRFYHEDKRRRYEQCLSCDLVFVPSEFWLNLEDEKAVYDLHQNSPEDQGYCRFLSRLIEPLLSRIASHQQGLDFGCGPGPTLSVLLENAGHTVAIYDPIYEPSTHLLAESYDFVCATEVVEHLKHPAEVFQLFSSMIKPGGWLGLMTKQVIDQKAFSRWHYIQDQTHICFYSPSTFDFIAECFSFDVEFNEKDVILLKKRL